MSTSRRTFLLAVAVLATTAACGPSAAQLRQAREAHYRGSRAEVFTAAMAAVEPSYKVLRTEPETGTILTVGRWYEPDGTSANTADANQAGVPTEKLSQSGSVFLGFVVRVVGDAPPYQVLVQHSAHQIRSNYSAPYKFLPEDPELPGWVIGKVDNLQLDIHRRLGPWEAVAAPTVAQK